MKLTTTLVGDLCSYPSVVAVAVVVAISVEAADPVVDFVAVGVSLAVQVESHDCGEFVVAGATVDHLVDCLLTVDCLLACPDHLAFG